MARGRNNCCCCYDDRRRYFYGLDTIICWILGTGFWRDECYWNDTQNWID